MNEPGNLFHPVSSMTFLRCSSREAEINLGELITFAKSQKSYFHDTLLTFFNRNTSSLMEIFKDD